MSKLRPREVKWPIQFLLSLFWVSQNSLFMYIPQHLKKKSQLQKKPFQLSFPKITGGQCLCIFCQKQLLCKVDGCVWVSLRAAGWLFPPPLPQPRVHHQPLSESSRLGTCCSVKTLPQSMEKEAKESLYLVVMLLGSHRLSFSPTNPQPSNKQTNKQLRPFASTSCDWVTLSRKLVQVTQGRSRDVQGLIYPRIKDNIPSNFVSPQQLAF